MSQTKLNLLYGHKIRLNGLTRRKESQEKIDQLKKLIEQLEKELTL